MIALLAGATGVAAGTWLAGWVALPVSGAAVGAWLGWAARREASRAQAPAAGSARAACRGDAAADRASSAQAAAAGSAGAPGVRPRPSSTRRWAPVATAALAGVLGWGVLLLCAAARGPVAEVARLVGGVLGGLPGPAFFLVVLLFAGLLAGAAGGMSEALVHLGGGARSSSRKTE